MQHPPARLSLHRAVRATRQPGAAPRGGREDATRGRLRPDGAVHRTAVSAGRRSGQTVPSTQGIQVRRHIRPSLDDK